MLRLPPALLTVLMSALLTAGCGWHQPAPVPGTGLGSTPTMLLVDTVSLVNTGKTVDDHIIGAVLGEDCSIIAAQRGESYCKEWPKPVPTALRTSYCYKSLAAVTCYDRPLPQDQSRFVGTRVDKVPLADLPTGN